jgi:hypothetical protein
LNQIFKRIFYSGIIGISLFEILNVYFIMPMPGSQEISSLSIAYFLYSHRWIFRAGFSIMIAIGFYSAFKPKQKWIPAACLIFAITIIYLFNFRMTAERIFTQPGKLNFQSVSGNKLSMKSVVIGVENNGEVKAYPIQFLVYHHQVQDTIGGKLYMVTYCSVCRTGRVYVPMVGGHAEKFRLVGMDHFNAMFEDITTRSWWRQSTGEAVSGPLKGVSLPEKEFMQLSIKKLFDLYPSALVMQADEASKMEYDSLRKFEQGISKSKLTGTDSLSWRKKSWVIGIQIGSESKVYDWNKLKTEHIINDTIGVTPIFVALSADGESFNAFERPKVSERFSIRNDTIFSNGVAYDFSGRNLEQPDNKLRSVKVFQEFWHSWKTFHPNTILDQ